MGISIFSYIIVFALGIIAGMCLAGLLSGARHNIDETQPQKPIRHDRRPSTPESFRPSMHDEAE